MNTVSYNRDAWNKQSRSGSRWSQPVDSSVIASAKAGEWEVILTPNKSVPQGWFGNLSGKKVLCLASGGGQQAPILAAAGARVHSFDNSDEQLAKDLMVAERDQLDLKTCQGDMADLSAFADESFDLIFHPVSNVFSESIRPVWQECFRVLKRGGRLLSGFMNPMFFLFDHEEAEETGTLEVQYALPFSDLKSLPKEKLDRIIQEGLAFEFGHTLDDQIGGQIEAGFAICGFYEDDWDDQATPLNKFASAYIATLARKIEFE
ncbi:class I SAM-dependent methyltransferase [Rubellicoccus peritrichatus]|uniref:Class I SAM-dependent methyltransferase n=1 Tax=Rubellicoccus peritrichatus TaxID=3080537 RepID=A0AAQ3QX52_9BACT|nr:class I SAM-dependent methyltransferase [Puniceicoccus sp. CR14]WOO43323.1 class I SAM-dependent methyltransferase [Puniceicoccus sp. CR14]